MATPARGRLKPVMQGLAAAAHLSVSPLALVARTAGAYFAMLFGFRLFGKRELGQVTVFDVAVILLIANGVQNAMVGPDTSLVGGLIVAGSLLMMNFVVARLRIVDRLFRHLVEGQPDVLIADGRWHERIMRREGLDHDEVEAAMRANGVLEVAKVRLAVLETNGNISVVTRDTPTVNVKCPTKRGKSRPARRSRSRGS